MRAKDFKNPELGKYVEKYLKGKANVPSECRMRIIRLIKNMAFGTGLVEDLHGASPQTQRIMISRLANLESKKKLAKTLAGIELG